MCDPKNDKDPFTRVIKAPAHVYDVLTRWKNWPKDKKKEFDVAELKLLKESVRSGQNVQLETPSGTRYPLSTKHTDRQPQTSPSPANQPKSSKIPPSTPHNRACRDVSSSFEEEMNVDKRPLTSSTVSKVPEDVEPEVSDMKNG